MNTQAIEFTLTELNATHCEYLASVYQVKNSCNIKNITLYLGVDNEYKKLSLALHQGNVLKPEEIYNFKTRVKSAIKFLKSL